RLVEGTGGAVSRRDAPDASGYGVANKRGGDARGAQRAGAPAEDRIPRDAREQHDRRGRGTGGAGPSLVRRRDRTPRARPHRRERAPPAERARAAAHRSAARRERAAPGRPRESRSRSRHGRKQARRSGAEESAADELFHPHVAEAVGGHVKRLATTSIAGPLAAAAAAPPAHGQPQPHA